jgi:hypothetical protein
LASLPKNATKKQIVDAISQTAQKTGPKLITGFAAEAETGALQEATDVGIKKIYNEIKGKELFDTPQTVREFEDNVIRAGVAEGIGGFGTATLTAVSSFMAKGNLGEVTNDAQYELVEQIMSSPEALSAKKKQLKARLDAGKLTDEQYNIEINNIDVASQIVSEIDETLPTEKRRQAFDLITEKKKIQGELAELETKDQDLVSAKVEEKTKKLEEIGVRLKELTESQATPLQKGKRTTAEQYGDKKEVTLKKDLETTPTTSNQSEIELKNEGKAEAPTKENVTERLNINNPFYKKVEDALVKLGLIEKYNPETGTGDVVGGFVQQTSDGGFSVRKMLFSQDGSISYFDGDVKVSFDKNGNVISENTKEAKQKAISLEIEGKKESIANLEKIRDSEAFKYKEVTETDVLGNKKKVKKLKTPQELKESTDKINAAINKSKAELLALEEGQVEGGITKEVETKKEVTSKKQDEQVVILKEDREGGELFPYKGEDYVIQEEFDGQNSAFKIVNSGEVEKETIPNKSLKSFQNPLAVDKKVVEKADISKPIIIGDNGKDYFVIDGNHRLTKAMINGDDIDAYVLTEEQTESIKLNNIKTGKTKKALNEADTLIKEYEKESSGAKKPQEKQETATTATAEQKSKQQESEGTVDSDMSEVNETKLQEILKEGDDVTVYKDTYVDGKKTEKRYKAKVVKINDDGTYDLRRGKLVYKNIKPNKISKIKPSKTVDIKKETEGLTEKEVAKQGVEEIVQAYKNKLKEAKQKANEKISDEKQKARILKGNIKAAKDIITGIIEESIPKGVMLGKSILRDVANALTPKQIERVADRIERNVENIQRRNKINDIKSKQAKVKKKLPNFTNQQESVKEILNVDLTQVKDLGILQEIENELDAALERDVAKLDPKRMSELLDKLEQKSQPESKTTSKRKVSEKIQSLKESDKNSDKKIKELQSLNRALDKTLGLNQINQDDYNDALSIIEKELELLEKDRQEDTKKLNKDSVERLSKLDEKPFSKVQKDEIKRLRNVAGKSTKYRDALKLNEIIDELELGYIPVKQMDEYRNDAISYQESNNLSTQINKRTRLDSIKNKLASLLGLQREGTLRGSKKNKSFSDALNILELNNISSWNDLFGLGRKEGISNFLSPLFTNMIATTSENVRHIMNNYFTIKYPISPFKKGLTKDKEIALIMMRKQGDWEVTEGMDTDYWGELLSEKNIEEAKKQYNGDKSDISLKKLIKIYESLPKRKGKLDYEGYFENLKGVEKRMNDFLTKLAEDNAPLQEIANQRNGKEFVKRDSRYYLTDIVLRDSGGALEDGLGGLSFVLSNGVSLDAGVGETRTAGKKVKPILLDLDRIVNKQTTETIRDYNLSSNLKAIRKTFIRTIPQLTEPNARALMSMFGQALSIRMQAEYGIRAADSSRNFIGKLLGAARAYFLAGFKRVGVEFVAEVFRSLPATRKRYVPNAVKAIIQARAMGIKLHKELLARTGSPYLKKAYLESSAADSQVTADTKRTIFGRIADFVKAGSDGMMGVSSNVVFPQVWLPEFLYQFKQLTGKDFDVKNYSDAYFNKNEKDIRSAAIIADTNAERIFGGSTRAARRTKAKWLGTPVIGLIQSIQGKFTGDYSFGNKYKYVDPYTNFGMLNTFLSNFAGIEAYNTFTRGLKGILYGENVSRWKAGQYLLFGIISGTLYTYLRDEIMTILFGKGEDEEDERETEEKFIDAMINNIIFLSVGQYGQSAQLALRTFVGIYEDRLDDEQKKRFRRLSQDRFNVYPLNFGYGSITRAYDNLIPFLGETISTISQSKDVIMNAKEIEDGITLSEEEMMTLKAIELTNNMLKLAFTVKGTQIPMQRDIDRVLKALDKIESGKEITRSEYELLETYNFIPIIDEIYENADIKE